MISGSYTQLTVFYKMESIVKYFPPPPEEYSWHFPSFLSWGVGSLMGKAFPEVKFSLVFTSKESLTLVVLSQDHDGSSLIQVLAEAVYGLSSYVQF